MDKWPADDIVVPSEVQVARNRALRQQMEARQRRLDGCGTGVVGLLAYYRQLLCCHHINLGADGQREEIFVVANRIYWRLWMQLRDAETLGALECIAVPLDLNMPSTNGEQRKQFTDELLAFKQKCAKNLKLSRAA